eukprot:jgi/Bigna1/74517/fgenesh1_pg.29_\
MQNRSSIGDIEQSTPNMANEADDTMPVLRLGSDVKISSQDSIHQPDISNNHGPPEIETADEVPPCLSRYLSNTAEEKEIRRLGCLNDLFQIVSYNGEKKKQRPGNRIENTLRVNDEGEHIAKVETDQQHKKRITGKHLDLVLKSSTPVYLTHLGISASGEQDGDFGKNLIILAFTSERERPDIKEYVSAYKKLKEFKQFWKMKKRPGNPVGCFQTDPRTYEGALEVPRKRRSTPIQYLHIRICNRWDRVKIKKVVSTTKRKRHPRLDLDLLESITMRGCAYLVLVGLEEEELSAEDVELCLKYEKFPLIKTDIHKAYSLPTLPGHQIVRNSWKDRFEQIFTEVVALQLHVDGTIDNRKFVFGELLLNDANNKRVAHRTLQNILETKKTRTLHEDDDLVRLHRPGMRYILKCGGAGRKQRAAQVPLEVHVSILTGDPQAAVDAVVERTVKVFELSLFDDPGEAAAVLFIRDKDDYKQVEAAINSFKRASTRGPDGLAYCIAYKRKLDRDELVRERQKNTADTMSIARDESSTNNSARTAKNTLE